MVEHEQWKEWADLYKLSPAIVDAIADKVVARYIKDSDDVMMNAFVDALCDEAALNTSIGKLLYE